MNIILFDMQTNGSSLLPFPMPLMLLAIAALMIFGIFRKPPKSQRDSFLGKGGYFLMLGLVVVALAASLSPLALRPWAEATSKKASVVEGCVADFQRIVHPNGHNIADTYFSVGGVGFHFNSSPWLPGFHNEDDIIHPGDGLRITRSGTTVLRIERSPTSCHATAG